MKEQETPMTAQNLPVMTTPGSWAELLQPARRGAIEGILPDYIYPRRWFGAKARQIASARIGEAIAVPTAAGAAYLTLVQLAYVGGDGDTYALPLIFTPLAKAGPVLRDLPHAAMARIESGDGAGVLLDALFDPAFCAALLELIAGRRSVAGERGELRATPTAAFERLRGRPDAALAPKVGTAEQSNTSIIYGDRLIMKLFRKLEPGLNPDLEIGRFLTEQRGFAHVPPTAGTIEYYGADGDPVSLAFLQGFVPNQGDAWSATLQKIAHAFQQALGARIPAPDERDHPAPLLDLADQEPPAAARAVVGGYLASAALLGRRTAELHTALAADTDDPAFAPEPFDEAFRRALAASMRGRAERAFQTLRARSDDLPEPLRRDGQQILDRQDQILAHIQSALGHPIAAVRMRVHGDYHLGQVLAIGDDFAIIDFEGEPARPLAERRVKSSPLQDVAGMLRSFHYAPYAVLQGQSPGAVVRPDDARALEPWARSWHRWVSATFLKSYLATLGQSPIIPQSRGELQVLLDAYLLDKALYELAYELNNRPTWVRIPVEGILQLLGG